MKTCRDCQQLKPLADFNKNACKRDGLQTTCRACQRKRSKMYYVRNRERMVRQIIAARTKRRRVLRAFRTVGCRVVRSMLLKPLAPDWPGTRLLLWREEVQVL